MNSIPTVLCLFYWKFTWKLQSFLFIKFFLFLLHFVSLLIKYFIVLNFNLHSRLLSKREKKIIFFILEHHFIHFWPRETSVYYLSISIFSSLLFFFFALQIHFVSFQTRAGQLHWFLRVLRVVIFFIMNHFANFMRFSLNFF